MPATEHSIPAEVPDSGTPAYLDALAAAHRAQRRRRFALTDGGFFRTPDSARPDEHWPRGSEAA